MLSGAVSGFSAFVWGGKQGEANSNEAQLNANDNLRLPGATDPEELS